MNILLISIQPTRPRAPTALSAYPNIKLRKTNEVPTTRLALWLAPTLSRDHFTNIGKTVNSLRVDVLECHHAAGNDDYVLKVHVSGTLGFQSLVSDQAAKRLIC